MNEKKNVKITVVSKQEEVVTQYFNGELYVKGQVVYIKYVEIIEQQEIRHLIRYTPNEIKITRHGLVQSEQTYRVHERRVGSYDNKMIRLNVEAFTKRLVATDVHNNAIIGMPKALPFHLNFDYDLFVDGQSTGSFSIKITIQEGDV